MFEILILTAIAVSLGLATACNTRDAKKDQYQPYVRANSTSAYGIQCRDVLLSMRLDQARRGPAPLSRASSQSPQMPENVGVGAI
jgi:hypothetical protein